MDLMGLSIYEKMCNIMNARASEVVAKQFPTPTSSVPKLYGLFPTLSLVSTSTQFSFYQSTALFKYQVVNKKFMYPYHLCRNYIRIESRQPSSNTVGLI